MTVEPIVAISAIEHYAYCPRQCALIHVDGIWMENAHTVFGTRAHHRVDTAPSRMERGRRVLRGIPLFSERYGLSGRADVIEIHDDGSVVPVEYKAGVKHGGAAELQLCAQALCLEEMTGQVISHGFVWYRGRRHRDRIELSPGLRQEARDVVSDIRAMVVEGSLPAAAADTRCSGCQLESVCLPDVVSRPADVRRYVEREVTACE